MLGILICNSIPATRDRVSVEIQNVMQVMLLGWGCEAVLEPAENRGTMSGQVVHWLKIKMKKKSSLNKNMGLVTNFGGRNVAVLCRRSFTRYVAL